MHDVALGAGVSLQTVSNVLNHPERVRASTRERVMAAIEHLGFTPNANARSLAVGASDTIGLVLQTLNNSLFIDIARGAQREAARRKLKVLLADSDDDELMQREHLKFLDSVRVGGVILTPESDPARSLRSFARSGTPVVIANYAPEDEDHCAVAVDNEQVGYLAARHMISLGRRKMLLVTGREYAQPVRDRRSGVLRAVEDARGAVDYSELSTGDDVTSSGGVTAGARIAALSAAERPDAVIAVTDLLAVAIIGELSSAGLTVPDDVAVMGCDYDSGAWSGAIPLTTVRMMGEETGEEAIRMLEDEITNPDHHHRTVLLPPTLMARESTVGRRTLTL